VAINGGIQTLNNMTNTVILYLRVSTGLQDNSLEVQKSRLTDYCKFKKFTVADTIIDEDVSGGKPFYERPGGMKAKDYFKKGIKTIIVLKLDRIFRDVKDSLITIDEWGNEGISLSVVDMMGNSIDTSSAMGRAFFIQSISMGELERRLASERTRAVLNHKKTQGKIYCNKVFGYDKIDGKLIKNETEQMIIKEIIQLKSNNNNNKIAQAINEKGFKTKNGKAFQGSTINNIVNNSLHY